MWKLLRFLKKKWFLKRLDYFLWGLLLLDYFFILSLIRLQIFSTFARINLEITFSYHFLSHKIVTQNYPTLNHEKAWSQNFLFPRSNYLLVQFHFKDSGQFSSAILPTRKVMKKNIWNKIKRISVLIHGTIMFTKRKNTRNNSTRIFSSLW